MEGGMDKLQRCRQRSKGCVIDAVSGKILRVLPSRVYCGSQSFLLRAERSRYGCDVDRARKGETGDLAGWFRYARGGGSETCKVERMAIRPWRGRQTSHRVKANCLAANQWQRHLARCQHGRFNLPHVEQTESGGTGLQEGSRQCSGAGARFGAATALALSTPGHSERQYSSRGGKHRARRANGRDCGNSGACDLIYWPPNRFTRSRNTAFSSGERKAGARDDF